MCTSSSISSSKISWFLITSRSQGHSVAWQWAPGAHLFCIYSQGPGNCSGEGCFSSHLNAETSCVKVGKEINLHPCCNPLLDENKKRKNPQIYCSFWSNMGNGPECFHFAWLHCRSGSYGMLITSVTNQGEDLSSIPAFWPWLVDKRVIE